ncbi:carbohydrate ABC transporter permease [Zhihengliuella halotolerans]|uniref:Carbohydrate ABC transporter membrane protein 2 (CUT1 family) n=1 Tax=Zhihengliuella halotolerans TaxID=370736 RepID=A0A4Q8AIR6_9MICC|nr:carbohydrate ABC transporter permease [Zhihengliuella halotolerans]RZU63649.1 carbohydrate ABC transporter membrane protein 2 (CUT1 family) [Zhihengliuella halotolerans]
MSTTTVHESTEPTWFKRTFTAERPPWQERQGPFGLLLKGIATVLVLLAVLLPLYTVVLTSFSGQEAITEAGGLVLVPGELTLAAYRTVLAGGVVTQAAMVSIFVTVVGTSLSVLVSILAAYGLSRPASLWHRPILFTFLITMFFGAGMIPTYLLVSSLGLINTLWSLILPTAVSAFNVLVLRAFFMGIDQSILEAARIDGASDWRILFSLVVPMSKAAIAVVAMFYAVGYFNAFFNAMLYINDNSLWPLQLVLRSYVLQGVELPGGGAVPGDVAGGAPADLAVKMAIMVLAILPILAVYPFVQRHFTKGVIFGAIKG